MVGGILVGIFGSTAYETLKKLVKKISGDIHEDDPIINKTYQAVERACQRFLNKYKKKFGPPADSFLAREENHEILIRRIYIDSKGLTIDNLNPNGFRGAPKATAEALEFLVKVFEEELKTDRELVKEMETIRHHRQMDQVVSVVDKLKQPKDQELPQLLTPLPPRKIRLIGRKEDLKNLEQRLQETDRVLLVNGLGGIGKTEVCKRFFYDHYKEFSHAAWVDYVSSIKETLVNAFAGERYNFIRVNPQDSLDDLFHKVLQFLNGLNANSLLIIDNIEDPEDEDLDKITSLPFKVIANSRLNLKGFDIHSLDFLSDDSCKALFYEHYKGEGDDAHVEKIIHLCNRHTLTMELLARTAQNSAMPVKTLYETLEKKGFNLNELIGEKVGTFWRNEKNRKQFFEHLLTIFDLSRVTESELHVLTNLSVLPPIYIDMNELREWLKLKTKDDINSLVIKGWLKQEGFNIFMHQVIQEVIRHKIAPDAKKCENLITSLAMKLNLEPGENPTGKKGYIIFAYVLLQYIHENVTEIAALSNNLALMYSDMGQLEQSFEFQIKAAKIREEVLDKHHPDLATSYTNLAGIYLSMGQLEQALKFQEKALKIREQVLDKNHPDLAQSYHNLSFIYRDMKDYKVALQYAEKAVAIQERLFPNGHPNLDLYKRNLEEIRKRGS